MPYTRRVKSLADVDLVLLTEPRFESPPTVTPYIANVLEEDRLLTEALTRRGIRTRRVDWSRDDVDWSSAPRALFRTTWDYFLRWEEFCRWLDRAEVATELLNPPALVRWNSDKRYLKELEERGVPIVETHIVEVGESGSLEERLARLGWDDAVLKPAVSGGGRHTYRVRRDSAAAHEAVFRELVASEAVLLQPFVNSVLSAGEVTLVLFADEVSHAVRKTPRAGEFRVQDDFGGSVAAHTPSAEEVAVAEAAWAACPRAPLYGRVDMVYSAAREPRVMELEIIEPELWMRYHPPAAERFAAALETHIAGSPSRAAADVAGV